MGEGGDFDERRRGHGFDTALTKAETIRLRPADVT
jgi:hypothetical protein